MNNLEPTPTNAANAANPATPDTEPRLPRRDPAGHKGTFGTVSIFGGCCRVPSRMIGAPALAAMGALRAGCGIARVVTPAPIIDAVLAIVPSATGLTLTVDSSGEVIAHEAVAEMDHQCASSSCVVVGPGMGDGAAIEAVALRAVMQDSTPVVVDADGLNALARVPEMWRDFRAPAILTPHPGEFARLARSLGVVGDAITPTARPEAAAALARRLGCVVVLKGAGTVVSNGIETWICDRGHACLATAGTGDVLAGVIAGLVAQHARGATAISLFDAARAGVFAHASAGESWARTRGSESGLLACELACLVPAQIDRLRA